jgi:hypothetical protein
MSHSIIHNSKYFEENRQASPHQFLLKSIRKIGVRMRYIILIDSQIVFKIEKLISITLNLLQLCISINVSVHIK